MSIIWCCFLLLHCVFIVAHNTTIYVYPKQGDLSHYNNWVKPFSTQLFGDQFDVVPVWSCKNLRNFEYIALEEVPKNNTE